MYDYSNKDLRKFAKDDDVENADEGDEEEQPAGNQAEEQASQSSA